MWEAHLSHNSLLAPKNHLLNSINLPSRTRKPVSRVVRAAKDKIAIIGGGAAGTSVFEALTRLAGARDQVSMSISIYEPGKKVGPGRVFRDDVKAALLNTPVDTMAFPGKRSKTFKQWLADNYSTEVANQQFVPRSLFGEYLNSSFEKCVESAKQEGHTVRVVKRDASAIQIKQSGISISTASGHRETFNKVVLCLGTGRPADPYKLDHSPSYISDIYPLKDSLKNIPASDDVLILGTGLSSIDAFRGLRDRAHLGKIVFGSRNGLLPAVRQKRPVSELEICTNDNLSRIARHSGGLTLEKVISLAKSELLVHGVDVGAAETIFTQREAPVLQLANQLENLERADAVIPLVRTMISKNGETIWKNLSSAEKHLLAKGYMSIIHAVRAPMPFEIASRLLAELTRGSVEVLKGLKNVTYDASNSRYLVSTTTGSQNVSTVVNTTQSQRGGLTEAAQRLIDQMIADGIAQEHEFGGIKTDFASFRVLSRSETPQKGLFAVGQITMGDRFHVNSFDKIAEGAEKVAARVLNEG